MVHATSVVPALISWLIPPIKAKLGAVLTVAGWAGVLGLAGGSVAAEETMSLASLPGDPGDAVGLAVRSSLLAAKRGTHPCDALVVSCVNRLGRRS